MALPFTEAGIKRRTVTSAVADTLRKQIITGVLEGGHQIRQEAVAAELGVSRIPVREALFQLESEGLVVIHTHRGAIVVELTIMDAIDIFDARLLLEPFMIKSAIRNATDKDIRQVRQALADYEKGLATSVSPGELSRLNWALHTAMAVPAARPRTLAVLQSLYMSADRYLRLQIDEKSAQERAIDDHVALTEAFAARHASDAGRLLKNHIAAAREDVVAGLKHRQNP